MTRSYAISLWIFMLVAVSSSPAIAQGSRAMRPHVPRQGRNLIANPTVDGKASWIFARDAAYDATVSNSDDGSGSIRLVTPIPTGGIAFTELIPVKVGQLYTYSFHLKTLHGPTYVGAQISLHDADKTYLRNHDSAWGGTTLDGDWQEFAMPFVVPEGVTYVGLQVYKTDNTQPQGTVWADDFYLGTGIGLKQPPSSKRAFEGTLVRVDELGNFEVKRGDEWNPYFPLCMYSDNYRDWSVYSKQGWNTIVWCGAAHQVKQAQDAVSDFNPHGMMAGFSIAEYTSPSHVYYNDRAQLRESLQEVFDEGLSDNLLLYYWDNENHHTEWDVPTDVIATIRSIDVSADGKQRRPVYALQGTFNTARVHAAHGLVDVSGTYVGGNATDTGGAGHGGYGSLFILDRLEQQTSPAAFAQFNGVDGPGDMRLRVYNSLILGARAIGYWRDCFGPNTQQPWSVGPVDEKPWWPDFPNLRREVDQLLLVIREPHWTDWTATIDVPDVVHIGTRQHEGDAYLLLVNQTNRPQQFHITLDQLPYEPAEVRSAFDDRKLATVSGGAFKMTLPAIGIDSGTAVVRLVSAEDSVRRR